MKPPPFRYLAPRTLDEALAALARHGDEAKLLAGGQSLVPMLNFRLLAPAVLLDINPLAGRAGLAGIAAHGERLRIGALTRHHALETAPEVRRRLPVLAAAMRHVAHLAIRTRGTIGGSLAHADPAAELPMLALLLDGEIEIRAARATRRLAAEALFLDALTTALAPDEIVTAVELALPPAGTGWGFEEVARRAGDFALAAVAATVRLGDGAAAEVRIAAAGVHPTPLRLARAEALLGREGFGPEALAAAAEAARDEAVPASDLHASADFRRHLLGVLTRRAVGAAWRRAREAAA